MNNDTPEQQQAKRESFGHIQGMKSSNNNHDGKSVAAQVHYEATHSFERTKEQRELDALIEDKDLW